MAPEVEKVTDETGYSAFQADVFSVGCVIYFLITGKEEWKGEQLSKVSEKNKLK